MALNVEVSFDNVQIANKLHRAQKEAMKLRAIALGCPEHPQNRFQRSPKSDCEVCAQLYKYAQEVNLWESESLQEKSTPETTVST